MVEEDTELCKVSKKNYLYCLSFRGIDEDFCYYMNRDGKLDLPRELVHETFTKWINEWVAEFNKQNEEHAIMLIIEDGCYVFTKCYKNAIFDKEKLHFPEPDMFGDECFYLNLGKNDMVLYGSIVECAIYENSDSEYENSDSEKSDSE